MNPSEIKIDTSPQRPPATFLQHATTQPAPTRYPDSPVTIVDVRMPWLRMFILSLQVITASCAAALLLMIPFLLLLNVFASLVGGFAGTFVRESLR